MSRKTASAWAVAAVLAAAGAARAGQARVLTDFVGEGEWKVSQWSKAKGRVAVRSESPPQLAGRKSPKALGVKISFPGGGGFHFFSLLPSKPPVPVSHRVQSVSVWLKGAGTKHYFLATFVDAKGADRKVELGTLEGETWRKRTFKVPSTWPQPLTLKSLSFHDWGINEPADVTVYLARMEAEVDPNKKAGGGIEKKVYKPLPRVTVPGAPRVYSDLNLAGEWRAEPWSKALGKLSIADDFPREIRTAPGEMRKSLQIDLTFAGGGFQFFSINPAAMEPIPYHVNGVQLWVKGSETPHTIEFGFVNGEGKGVKVSPKPGRLSFYGWQQLTALIPKSWPQPLTFKGITLHNWGSYEPAEIAIAVTRLVVIIDPTRKLGGTDDRHKTDDKW